MEKDMKLSFTKKISPSEAYMYGTKWDDEHQLEKVPLMIRHMVHEETTRRKVDKCSLPENMNTLNVEFSVRFFGNVSEPYICNDSDFSKSLRKKVEGYIEKGGLKELAYRYVYNLANARFLWKNRCSDKIDVIIEARDLKLKVNALDYSLRNFEHRAELEPLVEKVAATFAGEDRVLIVDVSAFAELYRGAYVHPSMGDGKATISSQKVGNAIRTIDTWYDAFGTSRRRSPISVEAYGVVYPYDEEFRSPGSGKDFYTLLDKFVQGKDISEEEEHFVMAMLIRGGIFGTEPNAY